MLEWEYYLYTRIIFGRGVFEKACNHIEKFAPKKAMVVTGRSAMKKLGLTEKLISQLKGTDAVVFDGVESNPSCETINRGVEIALKERCDLVIALGGGSAMDAAKAIAAIATNGGKVENYIYEKKAFVKKGLPVIAIPTTAGTASEINRYAVVSDNANKSKHALRSELLCPAIALIDPKLTVFTPRETTASTGLDTLAHAVESYWAEAANPITEIFALESIELLAQNLEKAYSNGNNLDAREKLCLASLYAGLSFLITGTTVIHRLTAYPVRVI